MTERLLFDKLLLGWIVVAALIFPLLFRVSAPYGRHNRKGWGPQIPRTTGWVLMEAPSPVGMIVLFLLGDRTTDPVPLVFLSMWLFHYIHRAFIFPFRMRGGAPEMPLLVALFAFCFNLGNAYFNGRYIFGFGPPYPAEWLIDPRFLAGALLFFVGLGINLRADNALLALRRDRDAGYAIPRGGLFELVSCPNYLGELLEWTGFALCTFALPGLTFALWTAANLVPRALAHHRWYRERFPDYPAGRRALIPYLL